MATFLDDDHDRDNYTVIFSNTPYEVLNDVQFDVGNFEINNLTGLRRISTCISFNIIQEFSDEVRKAFSKWYEYMFAHINDYSHHEYEANAVLLRYDKDGNLLRKYALDRVFPVNASFGYSVRGKSLATITITSYFIRIIDDINSSEASKATSDVKLREHDTIDKELEKEIYTKFNESVKENKDDKKEEKNTMSLDEVKPLVQMMDKLDDLREMLDNDDRLYECDFIEAISDYKEILEYRCLEAVKDACKDK